MKYVQHDHDIRPGFPYVLMVQAPQELHLLLESKGFEWQPYAGYYRHGKDEDWEGKDAINQRPYICIYEDGSWDGRAVEGYPMNPGDEIIDYLSALPTTQTI